MRIRLRSNAARCMGKIRGPNLSRRLVRLQAGWYGESLFPGGIRAAPSEADRLRLWVLRWKGCEIRDGELTGVSPERRRLPLPAFSRLATQYSSRILVFLRSSANFLYKTSAKSNCAWGKLVRTQPSPSILQHVSKRDLNDHSSGEPKLRLQTSSRYVPLPHRKAC